MKVHSSLQKRPLVLFEILVCMGVLSHTNNQVQAVQLNQLATQGLYLNQGININQLLALREDNVDEQQVQTEGGESVEAAQAEAQTQEQTQEQAATEQQQIEQQAVAQTEEQTAVAQQAVEQTQEAVVEEQPVAPVRRAAAKPVNNSPAAQQAAALAAAAEELYPDESKMNAAQKQQYRLKKAREAAAEKKRLREKDAKENPTVDENGEHIQTVAEAREEARQLQAQLEAGEAAVEEHLAQQAAQLAATPAQDLVQQEVQADDGHEETVEEVKAKMAALQRGMDEGIAATDQRSTQMAQEMNDMPDFGALANLHSSISNMGKQRKLNQMKSLADKLGVELQAGESELPADELTQTLIARAKEAGKTVEEISAAME